MFTHMNCLSKGLTEYLFSLRLTDFSDLSAKHVLVLLLALFCSVGSFGQNMKMEYYLHKAADESLAPNVRMHYVDSLNMLEPIWKHGELKSMVYYEAGRRDKAVECNKAMLEQEDLSLSKRLWTLYRLGVGYSNTSQYPKALNISLRILRLGKPDSLSYYDAKAMLLVSHVYNRLRYYSACERYLAKADSLLRLSKCTDDIRKGIDRAIQINISGVLLAEHRYEEALRQCKKLEKMNLPPNQRKFLDMNYASLFQYLGEPQRAEEYYKRLIQNTTEKDGYNINFEGVMSNYALFLLNRNRYAESEEICRRQIPRTYQSGERIILGLLYEIMGRSLAKQGRHEEAFEAVLVSNAIIDSIRFEQSPDISSVTSAFELQLADLERGKRHLGALWPWWLTLLLLILVVAVSVWAGWLIWRVNIRKNIRMHGLWRSMRQCGVDHYICTAESAGNLDDANRKLVALSLEKAEKEGILTEVAEVVDAQGGLPREKVAAIRNLVRGMPSTDHRWETFRVHFEKVHPRFFTNLHAAHPDLTPGEVKMAAFVVMSLSAKEIAVMLCRSQRTVDSARYRLHKKLGLGAGEKSQPYLRSLL